MSKYSKLISSVIRIHGHLLPSTKNEFAGLLKRWNQWSYLIMKSSQAWGFLLSPSTTGPYSCGSSPYCDMISPISAASRWSIKDSKPTVRMPVIYTQDDRDLSTMFHERLFMRHPYTGVRDCDDLLLLPLRLTLVMICLALSRKVPTTWRGRGSEIQNHALVAPFWIENSVVFILSSERND